MSDGQLLMMSDVLYRPTRTKIKLTDSFSTFHVVMKTQKKNAGTTHVPLKVNGTTPV